MTQEREDNNCWNCCRNKLTQQIICTMIRGDQRGASVSGEGGGHSFNIYNVPGSLYD